MFYCVSLGFIYLLVYHVYKVFHEFVRDVLVIYARSRWYVMLDRLSRVLFVATRDIDILF